MRLLLPLLAVVLTGCGKMMPDANPDPVEVAGRVTLNGKGVSDVTLTLQVTGGTGAMATLPVKNGDAKGSVVPGKYTYFIAEGTNAAAFQKIPNKYRAGAMDRQIEIAAGTTLHITLD